MAPQPVPHVAALTPYAWEASGADVAARAGIRESDVVRFDTNTAPWPPVAWEQTVLDLPRLPANEYPHPSNEPLRSALAARFDVPPEQVVVTCGADEALSLLAAAYLGPGRSAVMPTPGFSMFRVVTETVGATVVPVPTDAGWNVPADALHVAMCEHRAQVAWLCSPNNPTGKLLSEALVSGVAAAFPDAVIVVDEAYHEIAGVTLAGLLTRHENLVLVRTFSKGYGLAGARVGYAVAAPAITRLLDGMRLPQNLSTFGIAAAYRALQDEAGLAERVAMLRAERARLAHALVHRGWEVVPSEANFLLTLPPVQPDALSEWLQAEGLVVRTYAGNPRMAPYVRITVRAPQENARLLARIDAFRPEPSTDRS